MRENLRENDRNDNNRSEKRNTILLVAVVLLTALCLRAPITGVGSLIGQIGEDIPLTATGAGMLTTIPLLVFAVLSAVISQIADRMGAGICMFYSMIVMSVELLVRSLTGAGGLFLGTVLIGAGIAAGNVLIAAIVKAYFPGRVGLMTGIYATVMSIMGGVSSGISAPVAEKLGWQAALLIWIALAALAALLWLPMLSCTTDGALPQGSLRRTVRDAAVRRNAALAALAHRSFLHAVRRKRRDGHNGKGSAGYPGDGYPGAGGRSVQRAADHGVPGTNAGDYRRAVSRRRRRRNRSRTSGSGSGTLTSSRMTWAIVFYFGIQSLIFYTFVAWLPSILITKGFDPAAAGYDTSLFILVGIPATLFAPIFTAREGDECTFNMFLGLLFVAGILLILIFQAPVMLGIGTVLTGLAAGACFSQSMALFALRTRDAHDAAALSGLAQSVGYIFAALGPVVTGWFFDLSGSWILPLVGMALLGAAETVLGFIVGEEQIINE